MAELIDKGALMEKLNVFNDRVHGNEHFIYGIETAKELLEEVPTSYDVEKVVEQIKDYFFKVIVNCEEENISHEILEYNKAICEIVRSGGGVDAFKFKNNVKEIRPQRADNTRGIRCLD